MIFRQNNLINIIRQYLINRGRHDLAEKLSPGYCYGLELYFCDRAANNQLDSFYALLTAVAQWDNKEDEEFLKKSQELQATEKWQNAFQKLITQITAMPTFPHTTDIDRVYWAKEQGILTQAEAGLLLSAILPDNTDIEKLLNNIEWLQSKYELISKSMPDTEKMEFLHEADTKSVGYKQSPDFVAAMNIPPHALPELLAELPIDRAVQFATGRHGFACYRNQDGWQFYDSNKDTRTPIRTTPEELAKDIKEIYESEGISGTHIPLGILIFSKHHQTPWDFGKLTAICNRYSGAENIQHVVSKNPNDYPWDKISPLSLSILMNAPSHYIIRMIDSANDLTLTDSIGFQALHYAAVNNRHDIIQCLLKNKIDINQPIQKHDEKLDEVSRSLHYSLQGATPLHLAVAQNNHEMVSFLISAGADINAKTDAGLTPLSFAALKGHEGIYSLLIQNHANESMKVHIPEQMINELIQKQAQKITPLEFFGALDHTKIKDTPSLLEQIAIKSYLSGKKDIFEKTLCNEQSINMGSLLEEAIKKNDVILIKRLINEKKVDINNLSFSPLLLACKLENVKIIKLLLKKGLNILSIHKDYFDSLSSIDRTILSLSFNEKFHQILYPLLLDSLKHENAEKIDTLDEMGNAYIHYAILRSNKIVLENLLKMGANPLITNCQGRSPLAIAIFWDNSEAIKLLFNYGARLDSSNKTDELALDFLKYSKMPDKEEFIRMLHLDISDAKSSIKSPYGLFNTSKMTTDSDDTEQKLGKTGQGTS